MSQHIGLQTLSREVKHDATDESTGTPNRAVIVLCGEDATALGVAAAGLRERGQRVAIWLGVPAADDIIEMVDELFAPRPTRGVR